MITNAQLFAPSMPKDLRRRGDILSPRKPKERQWANINLPNTPSITIFN
jgi:hypothetical protein